jgi:hypothetical protein
MVDSENPVMQHFKERRAKLDKIESRINDAVSKRGPGWDRTVLDCAVELFVGKGTMAFGEYLIAEIARRRHALAVQLFDIEN